MRKASFMAKVLQNFINGELVDGVTGETTDLINPSTGEVYAKAQLSTSEDVDRAYNCLLYTSDAADE